MGKLRGTLQRGPLMFDMLWNAYGWPGAGTTLRLHDPWSPGFGKRMSVNALKWLSEVLTRTYRVFEK